ncbi:MAG TPA: DNA polymerase III subunit gamma/tau [Candidatus Acidoferrales bacterium]|nr:DNA polymerase III subunit gamma/tau [Candidatus Acidoferrales bacterium]
MSYQVIARKWRPQRFEEIAGQQHITRTLTNAIRAGRIPPAYIFSGQRGVGKTTTARILAKALNCEKGPTPEPCNECRFCREVTSGSSLDVMEIDAASNRGIDQIRELREMVRYASAGGRYRVVILDEAHQLTDEASNALLKTLEEPPERVLFILATTQPEDLPDTIRSRSQHFHFRSLSFQEIVAALEGIAKKEGLELEPAAVAVIARAAEGSVRDALSLVEQAMAYCGDRITGEQVRELLGVVPEEVLDEMMGAIAARSAERALTLAHRLVAEGRHLQHFVREAIRHVRNLLVARVAGAESELVAAPKDERRRIGEQAGQFSEEDLTRFFSILLETEYDLRRKPDPPLHLELGLLRMVNAMRLAPLEEALTAAGTGAGPARHPAGAPSGEAASAAVPAAPARGAARTPEPAKRQHAATDAATAGRRTVSAPAGPVPATSLGTVARGAGSLQGIEAMQVESILTAVRGQTKMLAGLVEQVTRWELDGSEMRVYFPRDRSALAEMLETTRDAMERLRTIASQVMGQPLRVCVKLDAAAAGTAPLRRAGAGEVRAKFERDPVVRAMLERFGGEIRDVRRRDED